MYDISKLSDPELDRHLDGRRQCARRPAGRDPGPRGDRGVTGRRYTGAGLHPRRSAHEEVREQLRAAVANSTIDDWIPSYVLQDAKGAEVGAGHLVDCADLARPEKFSGLDTVARSRRST